MTVSTILPAAAGILEAAARADAHLSDLIEGFLAADAEASEAAERARHANSNARLDDEAERLYGEAAQAWGLVLAEVSASGAELSEDVLDLGWEYWTARPRVSMPARAAAGDWRESVAAVDWSRGRP